MFFISVAMYSQLHYCTLLRQSKGGIVQIFTLLIPFRERIVSRSTMGLPWARFSLLGIILPDQLRLKSRADEKPTLINLVMLATLFFFGDS
jgi:hypothetical protein